MQQLLLHRFLPKQNSSICAPLITQQHPTSHSSCSSQVNYTTLTKIHTRHCNNPIPHPVLTEVTQHHCIGLGYMPLIAVANWTALRHCSDEHKEIVRLHRKPTGFTHFQAWPWSAVSQGFPFSQAYEKLVQNSYFTSPTNMQEAADRCQILNKNFALSKALGVQVYLWRAMAFDSKDIQAQHQPFVLSAVPHCAISEHSETKCLLQAAFGVTIGGPAKQCSQEAQQAGILPKLTHKPKRNTSVWDIPHREMVSVHPSPAWSYSRFITVTPL